MREVVRELVGLQADPSGILNEVAIVERVLVFEQRVVHLPELVLARGGLGRLGGVLGMRMRVRERKVAKDETQPFAQAAV